MRRILPYRLLLVLLSTSLIGSTSALASWEAMPHAFLVLRNDSPGNARAFVDLLEAAGGHASVVYPPRAIVAYADDAVLALPEIRAWVAEARRGEIDAATLAAYGPETQRAARAWTLALEMRDVEPSELPPGFTPFPDAGPRPVPVGKTPLPHRTAVSDNMPYGAEYYDTSEFLAGSTAVGVWLLEAAGSTYDWTQAEEDQMLAGIQASVDNWVSKGGAATFQTYILDIHTDVPVSGVPIENPQSWDGVWMDEVMNNEGWTGTSAWDKCIAYNNSIRDLFDTNWCYSIVVVDSDPTVNQGLFVGGGYAWAYFGGPWVYMSRYSTWAYNNTRYWGVVPMHEQGHIFFATDEYDGVQQSSGYLNVLDNITLPLCLMNQNDSTVVCPRTRRQLAWRDTDGNGVIEPLDVEPAAALTPYLPDPTTDTTPTWSGSANVRTLQNLNPYSAYNPPHDMTVVTIDAVECRVDAGAWTPATPTDGTFDEYVEPFTWTAPLLGNGAHVVEARAQTSVGIWTTLALASDTVTVAAGVGVEAPSVASAAFALHPVEPNPVTESARIRFSLPAAGHARLDLFGVDGTRVRTLVDAALPAGPGQAVWDGRDASGRRVPAGVYLFSLQGPAGSASGRLVVLR
jgi:hypothetical protein